MKYIVKCCLSVDYTSDTSHSKNAKTANGQIIWSLARISMDRHTVSQAIKISGITIGLKIRSL